MTYRVIGQRTNVGRFEENAKWDEHTQEFDNYSEATLYYSQIFSQVAEDICDLGGDFIFTLVADKEDGSVEVMKRHVVSTTILL
jgi:hypothetical protein